MQEGEEVLEVEGFVGVWCRARSRGGVGGEEGWGEGGHGGLGGGRRDELEEGRRGLLW